MDDMYKKNVKYKEDILLVDDDINILSSLKRLLLREGYNIFTANNGIEGLELLQKQNINLIISDMKMPEMNGEEFLAEVAKKWPETIRILLTGFSDLTSTINAINKGHIYQYVSKPWEDSELTISIANALHQQHLESERKRLLELTHKQNMELAALNSSLEKKVEERTSELSVAMKQLEEAHNVLKKNFTSTIKVFSSLIDLRKDNNSHSRTVSQQAFELAKILNLPEDVRQDILYAGLLHEIGKIGLPDLILNKPLENMRLEERREFIKHPAIAQALLMSLDNLHGAAKLIRSYEERYDGKGFPDHLHGSDIPMGSRILHIVSDYDYLQRGMITSKKMSAAEARDYLKQYVDIKYDPDITPVFIKDVLKDTNVHPVNSKHVKSFELIPGMVLTNDLVTNDGILLLSSGFILNKNLIDKIQNFVHSIQEELDIYVQL